MIARRISSRLPLLVYHPSKVFDPAYCQSIHAAGALPMLDTEFFTNTDIIQMIEALGQSKLIFGLRLAADNQALLDYLEANSIANLDLIVFTYRTPADLDGFRFDNRDYRFFIETTHINLKEALTRIDPHGLIVKGHEGPGRVSRYSAFVLLQWYLNNGEWPVFVHGGVGWHTAAGLFAMGAEGLVLDNQLFLAEEAPLAPVYKDVIRQLEEKDATIIGQSLQVRYHFFAKLGTRIVKTLRDREIQLAGGEDAHVLLYREIEAHMADLSTPSDTPLQSLFYLGQDAVFARHFARYGDTLAAMITGLFTHIGEQLQAVDTHDPMQPDSALAREHGTRYPIIQGPMANVSDNADFAAAVFAQGGLPFFALGNLPANLADDMLAAGKAKVERFGAGMIGIEAFNPTISHHLDSVKKHQAPFALFAGGIPSQVKDLEAAGTKTYLHTPSLMMLENALQKGCQRFIFEGAEAGGHVGTLSSLVLWELAMEKMSALPDEQLRDKTMVFAGGIGTHRAPHFISGMTSRLAGQGVKIGIQVGTAYLFSCEIIETGAIQKIYQDVVCERDETIVMGTTVGLASRTVATPFSQRMIENEHDRMREGLSLEERKKAFEKDNIGSLLIGAKAFCPKFDKASGEVCFLHYDEKEQFEKGNFMVGDGLAFYPCSTTIKEIHNTFFHHKADLLRQLNALEVLTSPRHAVEDEIAVIGMGCIYPGADSPEQLWENVVAKTYAIGEMPVERLNPALYFDEDRKATDKSYTKIAGVVRDFQFDHDRYGYTADKASRLSRSQQMILEAAYRAVADAGYLQDDLTLDAAYRASTAVIVATCLGNELGNDLHLKYWYPEVRHHLEQIEEFNTLEEEDRDALLAALREGMANGMDYEPVHGQLLNIEASRIAHHLGLTGINYIVDAACATSFAALDSAVKELLSGEYDMVISGGVNTNLAPESFVGFSKMGALSAKGSYPFDARADGFVLGEGAGVVVLKRMKDALRDGDRIYGVVKGIGSSSDGKGKAIAAPNPDGQALALRRCYAAMRDPVTVSEIGYIEAHGTSTIAGDQAEIETLKKVYQSERPIGISSIKSQIGHLLGGAGYAGMIKALMAINHGTLPPNGRFETLAPAHTLADTPLYIIEEARKWKADAGRPRLAAVSSYGFGGINYHCVVAECTPDYRPLPRRIFADLDYDFNDDRIVFAGLGVVLPESPDVDTFWQNLTEGRSVLSTIPEERFHNSAYAAEPADSTYHIPQVKAGVVKDYRFNNVQFRIPPATARSLDRAQLFALDAARQAIDAAALESQLTHGNRVGVVLGTLPGERQVQNILRVRLGAIEDIIHRLPGIEENTRNAIAARLREQIRDRLPENNEDTIPGLLSNIVSGRIANTFGCNGANFVVDASCASATVATRLAAMGLQSGEFDSVLTGGVDANFYPTVMLAFKRLSLLSDGDCRFFDKQAKGYVMSEGAALLVMTTYGHAKKHRMPIIGEFHYSAFNSSVPDHLLAPSEKVYRHTMRDCYRRLPITPRQIDHLDVFGVANSLLDQMEKQAIESTFDRPVYYGNIKPEFGYFKSANPAVAMTKLLLMNRAKTLLPNFSYAPDSAIVGPDSRLAANARLQTLAHRQVLYFAANVNGVGGNHGHTVVGTLPPWLPQEIQPAVAVAAAVSGRPAAVIPMKPNGVVALVSGQGAQYSGMLKDLYQENRSIRATLDQGNQIFQEMRGYSLLDIMFGKDSRLNLTENTQPAVFLSSAAIFTDLAARGFAPDRFIGHSVGEYSALYCAGLLNFEAAMRLIVKRADFMKAATEVHPGRIMVVFKDADRVHQLIRSSRIRNIYVANKNSDNQTAVSGAQDAIEAFGGYLKEAKVMFKALALSGAFHTPLFQSAAESMADYLRGVTFRPVDTRRIISNVTAAPYPEEAEEIKALLVRQIVSPVEFIRSVERVRQSGHDRFYEIGPGRILVNLLKNIRIEDYQAQPALNPKAGEGASFEEFKTHLTDLGLLAKTAVETVKQAEPQRSDEISSRPSLAEAPDFEAFLQKNEETLRGVLYQEFLKQKREQALKEVERFNFYTGKTVVAGTAIGLPGTGNKVFNSNNFDKILNGNNFIEPLSAQEKEKIVDMNITRVFKQPDGNARFLKITDTQDVIQLAGKLGYFNLKNEYGVDYDYDITISLAIAAGIEALKDARIPLVLQHKQTSTGQQIPAGYALPRELQRRTGVIMTSLFPGFETLIEQLNKYYYNKFYVRPYKELENIYYHLMESVRDAEIKEQITDWFFKIKERRKKYGTYQFERNLLFDVVPLGSAHFAQLIKAKGPNMLMSGACASTTQAVGVAEDWIRTGRCDRVVVIGGEASTSETQSPWIASGFLALGAASIKNVVADAAKPFDADRNGTILGAGAVSLIVEREDQVRERGLNGQAEILGTYIGNSAYHATQIDLGHLTEEMEGFVRRVEHRHDLDRSDYTGKMVFMSHETFTPARGGSASAEVASLKKTFPEHYRDITITNTKGYTGHTLGAAIEDAVMVKALQQHQVPPIANLTNIPEEFRDLRFSRDASKGPFEFGLHYAAGFGSHFAFLMIRRIEENRAADNPRYQAWLQQISGLKRPRLTTINNTLCIDPAVISPVTDTPPKSPPAAAAETKPLSANKLSAAAPLAAAADGNPLDTVKAIIAEQTGYTTDMLEDALDLEADLGIDTVKQVEIFGKVSERFGLEVPEDLKLRDLNTIAKLGDYIAQKTPGENTTSAAQTPAAEASTATVDVLATVKAIIAEQTGYTTDMLEDALDLEADLGIDTVKQVEIFGKVSERFGLEVPEDLKLRDLNTIAKLSGYIARKVPGELAAAAPQTVPPADAPAAAVDVLATVKAIIAEQTGYTTDMLEDALDLEADLGIDTVKQVEIFGKISERFGLEVPEDLKLRDLNTIAKLGDYIATQRPEALDAHAAIEASAVADPTAPKSLAAVAPEGPVKRLVIEAVPAAQASTGAVEDMTGQQVLITTGGSRLADLMAKHITARGGQALLVGSGENAEIPCDWQDSETVSALPGRLRENRQRIDGLIHLLPLESHGAPDRLAPHRIVGSLKVFFRLIQGLYDELDRPGTFIAVPTVHSTVFPYRAPSTAIDPLMAGLAGMLKTVNKELQDTRIKVVDFAESEFRQARENIAAAFLDELLSDDPRVECGYADGNKWVLQLTPQAPCTGERFVRDGDTLLVTGGARGITFEILKALTASVRLNLVILGRSNLDDLDPELADPALDTQALMAKLKARMPEAKPLAVKQALNRALNLRASRHNLETLRTSGATVSYHPVDVSDAEAVAAALAKAGKLDGVLHAAGIEESQFIPKKTLASFDRVFDTKVFGLRNLLTALEGTPPRYLMTFSSVTARLGNEGQVDYTAANDTIGKMLQHYRAAHPETIVKIFDWTAWEGAGMATNETVNKVLKQRGLTFLPLADGVAHFMRELGDTAAAEVVFSGIDHAFDTDGLLAPAEAAQAGPQAPFLDHLVDQSDDARTYRRVLDLQRDLFLLDHSREGIPIFLGATGIEAMAEAAAAVAPPEAVLQELRDFRIPYGIKILKGRPKEILVEAVRSENDDHVFDCRIHSQFRNPKGIAMGEPTRHYQGSYRFGGAPLSSQQIALPPFRPVDYAGDIQELLYHPSRLFMDGLFRTVEDIVSFEPQRLISRIVNRSTKPFFADCPQPDFMTDVAVVDAMFQTGGMLEVMTTNIIVLPYAIGRMRFYRPLAKGTPYLCITEKTDQGEETNTYQLRLVDAAGRLHMAIDDFQMVQVDRLAGEDQILQALHTGGARRAS